MGPTASGKTELAVELVQRLPLEIINVDSAQIYKGMDIGTAKPGREIRARAPHRLIDFLDPAEAYSAARFRQDALAEIKDIHRAGRIPLLTGGTMLYFRALERGLTELPEADPQIRAGIESQAERLGWPALHKRLARVDPKAGRRIHPNDAQRIQRALEILEATGRPPSMHYRDKDKLGLPWPVFKLVLQPVSRKALYETIEKRFEHMMAQGFLDEVAGLRSRADLDLDKPAMRAVGYRQLWRHLDGEWTLEEAVRRGVVATRQFAKRQLTWLRADESDLKLGTEEPRRVSKALNWLAEAL